MQLKSFFAQDIEGNVLSQPEVTVYEKGTTTLVTNVKDKNYVAKTNPFNGTTAGFVELRLPDGEFDIKVEKGLTSFTKRETFYDDLNKEFTSVEKMLEAANAGKIPVGTTVKTLSYIEGQNKGSNEYTLKDAGSAGARPTEDLGSVFHVSGGSGGLWLEGLFLDGIYSVSRFGASLDGGNDYQAGQNLLYSGQSVIKFEGGFHSESELFVPESVRTIYGDNELLTNSITDNLKCFFKSSRSGSVFWMNLNLQPTVNNSSSQLLGAAINEDGGAYISIDTVVITPRGNIAPEGDGITLVKPLSASVSNVTLLPAGYDADNPSNTEQNSPSGISVWQGKGRVQHLNCKILSGWGHGFVAQVDENASGAEDMALIQYDSCLTDGVHGHGYRTYNDDIDGSLGIDIKRVSYSNCWHQNGTGKMYNNALGLRIYGIGFYNQGAKNVKYTNAHVVNSLQNTDTSPSNPIPSAAFASTNGSIQLATCSAIGTYDAPALHVNAQRSLSNIYSGLVDVDGFVARDNDNAGNDASMKFTQCEKITLRGLDIEKTDTTSPVILVDSTGATGVSDHTGEVTISSGSKIKGGLQNIKVTDTDSVIISSDTVLQDAGTNAISLSNVGYHNIQAAIQQHARSSGSSAISTSIGDNTQTFRPTSKICNVSVDSDNGTGMALDIPTWAYDNQFGGVTNEYPAEYGEYRVSNATSTPDVFGCRVLRSSSTTTITDFANAGEDQTFTFIQVSGTITITDNSNIRTKSGSSITMSGPSARRFRHSFGVFYEE